MSKNKKEQDPFTQDTPEDKGVRMEVEEFDEDERQRDLDRINRKAKANPRTKSKSPGPMLSTENLVDSQANDVFNRQEKPLKYVCSCPQKTTQTHNEYCVACSRTPYAINDDERVYFNEIDPKTGKEVTTK